MNLYLYLVLLALTCWRVVHLIADDQIPVIAKPREWFIGRVGQDSSLAYLVECYWCLGVWVGAAGAAVAWWQGFCPGQYTWVLGGALSLAGVVGETVIGALDAIGGDDDG